MWQHYNAFVFDGRLFALQFLIGMYTYGKDRLYDALDAEHKTILVLSSIVAEKEKLYSRLLDNEKELSVFFETLFYVISVLILNTNVNIVDSIVCVAIYKLIRTFYKDATTQLRFITDKNYGMELLAVFLVLLYEWNGIQLFPFILLLESTNYYKQIKQENGVLKPFYVSFMWVISTLIMPCVLIDGNYSILMNLKEIIAPFLLMFSSSNLADIKDTTEDYYNGIQTIPVILGNKIATGISIAGFVVFLYLIQDDITSFVTPIAHFDKKDLGYFAINYISNALPSVEEFGHNILRADNELISYILADKSIPHEIKSKLVLLSIQFAQMGDNIGSKMLQLYFDFVRICLEL